MNKSIISIWVVSLGLVFWVGKSFNNTANPTELSNSDKISRHDRQNTGKAVGKSSSTKTSSQQNRIKLTAGSRMSVKMIMSDIKAIIGNRDPSRVDVTSIGEAYELVRNLNEEELRQALELMAGKYRKPSNTIPLQLMLSKLAEINPQGAMEFYEAEMNTPALKMISLRSILSSWSKVNPEAAFEWYLKDDNKVKSAGILGGTTDAVQYIFEGLAVRDLPGSIDKLKTLDHEGFEGSMAATGIIKTLRLKEDFVEFFEKTKDLDHNNYRYSVIGEWVSRNPQEAIEWVDAQVDKTEKEKFKSKVLSSWMDIEPEAAAEWYVDNAEPDMKQAAVSRVAMHWDDPQKAIDWINDKDGLDKSRSIEGVLMKTSMSNPDFVIKNLNLLPDQDSKKKVSKMLYSMMRIQNPKKAKEFLESSNFTEEDLRDKRFEQFNFQK